MSVSLVIGVCVGFFPPSCDSHKLAQHLRNPDPNSVGLEASIPFSAEVNSQGGSGVMSSEGKCVSFKPLL